MGSSNGRDAEILKFVFRACRSKHVHYAGSGQSIALCGKIETPNWLFRGYSGQSYALGGGGGGHGCVALLKFFPIMCWCSVYIMAFTTKYNTLTFILDHLCPFQDLKKEFTYNVTTTSVVYFGFSGNRAPLYSIITFPATSFGITKRKIT